MSGWRASDALRDPSAASMYCNFVWVDSDVQPSSLWISRPIGKPKTAILSPKECFPI